MPVISRVDELGGDPHPIARFADAPLQDITHAERLADLLDMNVPALEREGGIAGDDEELGQFRQSRDDVLGDAVGEIVLLCIAAHVLERQDRDRWLFGRGGFFGRDLDLHLGLGFGRLSDLKRIDPHRVDDVLELFLAKIADQKIEPGAHLPIGVLGEANRAGLGDSLEPRRNVDAVAHEIPVALLDDVAHVDADPEFNAAVFRHAGVALDHRALDFDGAADGVHHGAEFDQRAVARALDHATLVDRDGRIDEIAAQRPQARQRPILVGAGKTAEPDHIGGENRREFAHFGHWLLPAARR
jgi:hypothetical protein